MGEERNPNSLYEPAQVSVWPLNYRLDPNQYNKGWENGTKISITGTGLKNLKSTSKDLENKTEIWKTYTSQTNH